jgi:hypothetical protein
LNDKTATAYFMGVLDTMAKNKVDMTYETGLILLNYWARKQLFQPFIAVVEDMIELDLILPYQLITRVRKQALKVCDSQAHTVL